MEINGQYFVYFLLTTTSNCDSMVLDLLGPGGQLKHLMTKMRIAGLMIFTGLVGVIGTLLAQGHNKRAVGLGDIYQETQSGSVVRFMPYEEMVECEAIKSSKSLYDCGDITFHALYRAAPSSEEEDESEKGEERAMGEEEHDRAPARTN